MSKINRLVIATHNAPKAKEMVQILKARFPNIQFKSLADYPSAPEPAETGSSYAENATIKSRSAANATGEWAIADDAGLEIDALDGAPGLFSKRFGGESLSFPEKMERILQMMREVPEPLRTARFRCCVALSPPHGATDVFEATCEGRIAAVPKGSFGFGYDPIFFLPELGKHMAELKPVQKHEVSHRGKVLGMVAEYLERILAEDD